MTILPDPEIPPPQSKGDNSLRTNDIEGATPRPRLLPTRRIEREHYTASPKILHKERRAYSSDRTTEWKNSGGFLDGFGKNSPSTMVNTTANAYRDRVFGKDSSRSCEPTMQRPNTTGGPVNAMRGHRQSMMGTLNIFQEWGNQDSDSRRRPNTTDSRLQKRSKELRQDTNSVDRIQQNSNSAVRPSDGNQQNTNHSMTITKNATPYMDQIGASFKTTNTGSVKDKMPAKTKDFCLDISDIPGTSPKRIRVKRARQVPTNPLVPNYIFPGCSEDWGFSNADREGSMVDGFGNWRSKGEIKDEIREDIKNGFLHANNPFRVGGGRLETDCGTSNRAQSAPHAGCSHQSFEPDSRAENWNQNMRTRGLKNKFSHRDVETRIPTSLSTIDKSKAYMPIEMPGMSHENYEKYYQQTFSHQPVQGIEFQSENVSKSNGFEGSWSRHSRPRPRSANVNPVELGKYGMLNRTYQKELSENPKNPDLQHEDTMSPLGNKSTHFKDSKVIIMDQGEKFAPMNTNPFNYYARTNRFGVGTKKIPESARRDRNEGNIRLGGDFVRVNGELRSMSCDHSRAWDKYDDQIGRSLWATRHNWRRTEGVNQCRDPNDSRDIIGNSPRPFTSDVLNYYAKKQLQSTESQRFRPGGEAGDSGWGVNFMNHDLVKKQDMAGIRPSTTGGIGKHSKMSSAPLHPTSDRKNDAFGISFNVDTVNSPGKTKNELLADSNGKPILTTSEYLQKRNSEPPSRTRLTTVTAQGGVNIPGLSAEKTIESKGTPRKTYNVTDIEPREDQLRYDENTGLVSIVSSPKNSRGNSPMSSKDGQRSRENHNESNSNYRRRSVDRNENTNTVDFQDPHYTSVANIGRKRPNTSDGTSSARKRRPSNDPYNVQHVEISDPNSLTQRPHTSGHIGTTLHKRRINFSAANVDMTQFGSIKQNMNDDYRSDNQNAPPASILDGESYSISQNRKSANSNGGANSNKKAGSPAMSVPAINSATGAQGSSAPPIRQSGIINYSALCNIGTRPRQVGPRYDHGPQYFFGKESAQQKKEREFCEARKNELLEKHAMEELVAKGLWNEKIHGPIAQTYKNAGVGWTFQPQRMIWEMSKEEQKKEQMRQYLESRLDPNMNFGISFNKSGLIPAKMASEGNGELLGSTITFREGSKPYIDPNRIPSPVGYHSLDGLSKGREALQDLYSSDGRGCLNNGRTGATHVLNPEILNYKGEIPPGCMPPGCTMKGGDGEHIVDKSDTNNTTNYQHFDQLSTRNNAPPSIGSRDELDGSRHQSKDDRAWHMENERVDARETVIDYRTKVIPNNSSIDNLIRNDNSFNASDNPIAPPHPSVIPSPQVQSRMNSKSGAGGSGTNSGTRSLMVGNMQRITAGSNNLAAPNQSQPLQGSRMATKDRVNWDNVDEHRDLHQQKNSRSVSEHRDPTVKDRSTQIAEPRTLFQKISSLREKELDEETRREFQEYDTMIMNGPESNGNNPLSEELLELLNQSLHTSPAKSSPGKGGIGMNGMSPLKFTTYGIPGTRKHNGDEINPEHEKTLNDIERQEREQQEQSEAKSRDRNTHEQSIPWAMKKNSTGGVSYSGYSGNTRPQNARMVAGIHPRQRGSAGAMINGQMMNPNNPNVQEIGDPRSYKTYNKFMEMGIIPRPGTVPVQTTYVNSNSKIQTGGRFGISDAIHSVKKGNTLLEDQGQGGMGGNGNNSRPDSALRVRYPFGGDTPPMSGDLHQRIEDEYERNMNMNRFQKGSPQKSQKDSTPRQQSHNNDYGSPYKSIHGSHNGVYHKKPIRPSTARMPSDKKHWTSLNKNRRSVTSGNRAGFHHSHSEKGARHGGSQHQHDQDSSFHSPNKIFIHDVSQKISLMDQLRDSGEPGMGCHGAKAIPQGSFTGVPNLQKVQSQQSNRTNLPGNSVMLMTNNSMRQSQTMPRTTTPREKLSQKVGGFDNVMMPNSESRPKSFYQKLTGRGQ